jgi:hypothetical protein
VETEKRPTDAGATDLNATDTNAEAVETETRATDVNTTYTNAEAVETKTRATDVNATDTNAEAVETETRATNRNTEAAEIRPNLIWDNEAPGLCVRCYGDGAKSFIFVYRRDDRQRFVRIGKTPTWSLEGARRWAKELRSAVDRGDDPESYNRERQKIQPVESFIQFIAEHLQTAP